MNDLEEAEKRLAGALRDLIEGLHETRRESAAYVARSTGLLIDAKLRASEAGKDSGQGSTGAEAQEHGAGIQSTHPAVVDAPATSPVEPDHPPVQAKGRPGSLTMGTDWPPAGYPPPPPEKAPPLDETEEALLLQYVPYDVRRAADVRMPKSEKAPPLETAGEKAPAHDEGHPHLINGEFQSDKYPTCPRGKVPLSCKDPTAQDLLWEYAQRRRVKDAEFATDLEIALRNHGYVSGEEKAPEPDNPSIPEIPDNSKPADVSDGDVPSDEELRGAFDAHGKMLMKNGVTMEKIEEAKAEALRAVARLAVQRERERAAKERANLAQGLTATKSGTAERAEATGDTPYSLASPFVGILLSATHDPGRKERAIRPLCDAMYNAGRSASAARIAELERAGVELEHARHNEVMAQAPMRARIKELEAEVARLTKELEERR